MLSYNLDLHGFQYVLFALGIIFIIDIVINFRSEIKHKKKTDISSTITRKNEEV